MLNRIASPFREFGPVAGLLYLIDRLLSSVSPHLRLYVYELMMQPVSDAPLLPARFASQLEVREVKPTDPELALMPARPDAMQARLAQNSTCLGAFKKGTMIGYMWFSHPTYEEDEVRCTYALQPSEQSVFDYDFYLFPEHRMGFGFVALWNGANAFLRGRGIRYTFSRMTRFNTASRRAHRHLGGKRVGQALFLQAWRLEAMVATIAPYVHVSVTERARVRLTLRADVSG